MDDNCITCNEIVLPSESAITCDNCLLWNHIECATGITEDRYNVMVERRIEINWVCNICIESQESHNNAIELGPYVTNQNIDEVIISVVHPIPVEEDIAPITYDLIEGVNKLGGNNLFDSQGYTYSKKSVRENQTPTWRCIKSRRLKCRALVKEINGIYSRNNTPHICNPDLNNKLNKIAIVNMKKIGIKRHFEPASNIATEILKLNNIDEFKCKKMTQYVDVINYNRKKDRPEDIINLNFIMNMNHIPDNFLKKDIHNNRSRHIIFFHDSMKDIFSKSRVWFMDGTFKIVKKPFMQLYTISIMVTSGESTKQIPVIFILMSSRRKEDYNDIFNEINNLVPINRVVRIVADFERAVWGSVKEIYPNVQMKGCFFHFCQSVMRRVQLIGLKPSYSNNEGINLLVRCLMALPLIPSAHIISTFNTLKLRIPDNCPLLKSLFDYVLRNWIDSNTFPKEDWCVFGLKQRTNNDAEGWHSRLNKKVVRC